MLLMMLLLSRRLSCSGHRLVLLSARSGGRFSGGRSRPDGSAARGSRGGTAALTRHDVY